MTPTQAEVTKLEVPEASCGDTILGEVDSFRTSLKGGESYGLW